VCVCVCVCVFVCDKESSQGGSALGTFFEKPIHDACERVRGLVSS